MSKRFKEICEETSRPFSCREEITNEHIKRYAFQKYLRRMSDEDHDIEDQKRFANMSENEIKEQLVQDMLKGLPP